MMHAAHLLSLMFVSAFALVAANPPVAARRLREMMQRAPGCPGGGGSEKSRKVNTNKHSTPPINTGSIDAPKSRVESAESLAPAIGQGLGSTRGTPVLQWLRGPPIVQQFLVNPVSHVPLPRPHCRAIATKLGAPSLLAPSPRTRRGCPQALRRECHVVLSPRHRARSGSAPLPPERRLSSPPEVGARRRCAQSPKETNSPRPECTPGINQECHIRRAHQDQGRPESRTDKTRGTTRQRAAPRPVRIAHRRSEAPRSLCARCGDESVAAAMCRVRALALAPVPLYLSPGLRLSRAGSESLAALGGADEPNVSLTSARRDSDAHILSPLEYWD
ncbi:hypothetical protein DFH06DRAFT_1369260 [Mycena polygramma]|nr:hypothetical protein DFH06DRAFT_1369260 [Mycena polygramma]